MINVRDLISQLRKVEDQNLLVVAYDGRGGTPTCRAPWFHVCVGSMCAAPSASHATPTEDCVADHTGLEL